MYEMNDFSNKYKYHMCYDQPIHMFPQMEFYGSTTVGERGQVVLPAEVRKKFGIEPGQKLLVLGPKDMDGIWAITLVESSVLSTVFSKMSKSFGQIMQSDTDPSDESEQDD